MIFIYRSTPKCHKQY